MRTIEKLEDLIRISAPLTLAAGAFDGVHKGHQAVIALAQHHAQQLHGETWILTFDPHPLKVLRPNEAPSLITSTPHKIQLLSELGIRGCAVIPFSSALSVLEPENFIEKLCGCAPTLKEIVIGDNWRFGHRARGDAALLKKLGAQHGFKVTIAPRICWKEKPISSTRIRQAVSEGLLDEAEAMLGRPFTILGTVVSGKKLGRELGFPTANVDPHNEVRPPAGIYAVRVRLQEKTYDGAAYLGTGDIVEVHLINEHLDLYGKDLEIQFIQKVRDDLHFNDIKKLEIQIAEDVNRIKQILVK